MSGQFAKVPREFLHSPDWRKVGPSWALYLLMYCRANWQTGEVCGWLDKEAAEELGASLSMVRKWRRNLEDGEFITSTKHSHDMTIRLNRWGDSNHFHIGRVSKNGDSPKMESDQNTNKHGVTHHLYSDKSERAVLRTRQNGKAKPVPYATRRTQ